MVRNTLAMTALIGATCLFGSMTSSAETIKVEMTAQEVDIAIDNAGNTRRMWTYDGTIPGPVVRVKQGDLVQFTLHNHPDNGNSHSMDFHAAQLDDAMPLGGIKPSGFRVQYDLSHVCNSSIPRLAS